VEPVDIVILETAVQARQRQWNAGRRRSPGRCSHVGNIHGFREAGGTGAETLSLRGLEPIGPWC
jgi:hypothetical protein